MDTIDIHGIITLHEIPDEWTDEDLVYWWVPETVLGEDGLYHIIRPARISDEAKMQHAVARSENILTNAGVSSILTNLSLAGAGSLNPITQILSAGNGAFTGATRTLTGVSGDGFTSGARKAPVSYSVVGFQTTVVTNFASGDAVGTWTNIGFYGVNTGSGQQATTTTGTGQLNTIASFPFVKGSSAYAVNYVFLLSN